MNSLSKGYVNKVHAQQKYAQSTIKNKLKKLILKQTLKEKNNNFVVTKCNQNGWAGG